ncbi:IclR family transcriptional regulator domain-containing protein [Pseudaminobacter sp. NGMCC 1.201702]|uniref:IclR family transcriptional regulator domain-containing protein n=1 Tax=Pseudaminobacter sp. NGMCC 1.201702 TaxID=3391825 RepID=UPI0039EEF14B
MRKAGLEAYTQKTLVDTDALARDLAATRSRGWSIDDGERYPGMRCVAAAIFNEFGESLAGIAVSGPSARITPDRVAQIGPLVGKAAAAVTALIGGAAPSP